MRLRRATLRLLAGSTLLLALAAAITPFAGSRALAQENGEASITIYTAICPPGFTSDDYFGQCYDTPGDHMRYVLRGPSEFQRVETTGNDGFVAFEGINVEGQFSLQPQVPSAFVDVVARCSEDGAAFPIAPGAGFGQFLLSLTTDNDIRCDFYFVPGAQGGTSTLTIYKATCPAGYPGDDYYNACFENATAGRTFSVTPPGGEGTTVQGTTDANGFVSFELPTGTYIIEEDIPGEFAEFAANCTANGIQIPVQYSADRSRAVIDFPTGQDVRCDWFNLPFDLQGQTPTTAPQPTTPAAQATQPVGTLPSTGTGPGGEGAAIWPLAVVLVLIGLAAIGITAGRGRFARGEVRARR